MPTIIVDGQPFEAKEGENLLQAVLSQKLDLPYFCWHPAMGSVGACRQCAVIQYADENDERGRLAMACMTNVADGMRISIKAPHAEDFRSTVIEWLMENHPHDCPVCEEGGECHLQDMTVQTGHSVRRYRGQKRTWQNQYLGPFVGHEMNRCITCYRCVRFYRDYAGGKDLDAFGSRSRMYFGREEDGVLESEFAGNLVEVCPTGVFTDKPFSKHYSRKWDLRSAPSVCPGCAVGCNVFPAERYGLLKRVHNRYHGEVNGYFLCDRGRYGSHFVNSEKRIRFAGAATEGNVFEANGSDSVLDAIATTLSAAVVGIGSPRASLEANFALRTLVGDENFCNGMSDAQSEFVGLALGIYREGGFRVPTLTDVEEADAILILGEDVLNTAPRVALAIRQAVRNESFDMAKDAAIPDWQDAGVRGHAQHAKSPMFIASVLPTRIDDIAAATLNDAPADLARAGFQIANLIQADFAGPGDIGEATRAFASAAAEALAGASKPLIIAGTDLNDRSLIEAAANVAWALKERGTDPALLLAPPEANSFGVGLFPGGQTLEASLQALESGAAKTAVVLENDLFRRADAERVRSALTAADHVVVLDVLENETAELATLVLPAASYAESTGTFVNYETRAQRFYQVFEPNDEIAPSWKWLVEVANRAGRNEFGWEHVDDVERACAQAVSAVSGVVDAAPAADYRVEAGAKIPRAPHRLSGRTAMHAHISVHEPKTTVDDETPFSYSMEGQNLGHQDGALVPYVWSGGWNSNQSVFKFQQEVNGPLTGGDPGVRLLEVGQGHANLAASYRNVPDPFQANGGIRLYGVTTIFGSDELTGQSQPIVERSPAPSIVLNPTDAKSVGVGSGDGVRSDALPLSLEVRLDENVREGAAVVVLGLPGAVARLPKGSVQLAHDQNFVRRPGGDPNVIARG